MPELSSQPQFLYVAYYQQIFLYILHFLLSEWVFFKQAAFFTL